MCGKEYLHAAHTNVLPPRITKAIVSDVFSECNVFLQVFFCNLQNWAKVQKIRPAIPYFLLFFTGQVASDDFPANVSKDSILPLHWPGKSLSITYKNRGGFPSLFLLF